MSNAENEAAKRAKKAAKAAVKAAKKEVKKGGRSLDVVDASSGEAGGGPVTSPVTAEAGSPAERSARAAERKVVLERWRLVVAAVVGAAGILVAVLKGC